MTVVYGVEVVDILRAEVVTKEESGRGVEGGGKG